MDLTATLFEHPDRFVRRHIGPDPADAALMLASLGFKNLDDLVDAAIPKDIRLAGKLNLPPARSEFQAIGDLRKMAGENEVFRSYIGMGYYDCITPAVIQRHIFENPGWYTPYTPYQAEISQGRLEALLNFQTMVVELTALDIANASLLDEASACAEAMALSHRVKGGRRVDAEGSGCAPNTFFVSERCHPQNIAVLRTRARALGIGMVVGDEETFTFNRNVFGALVQYPDTFGAIRDPAAFVERAHAAGALVTVATDLLALTRIQPPGEFGADIAVGNTQRLGVPFGFGGPHAAFFATRDEFKRQMPGRLVGVSRDSRGKRALRLALGTREQHIRREKATSNICTAQALLANMASMYAVYHGPEGLRRIADRIHALTAALARGLEKPGYRRSPRNSGPFFDTLAIAVENAAMARILEAARRHKMNFRVIDETTLGISLDETVSAADVAEILQVFNGDKPAELPASASVEAGARQSKFLTHEVFNRYHSETEMLRYIKRLESRDLALTASMIPLGSCTMKLNAAAEMAPVSWPAFAKLHPFAPADQTRGCQRLFQQLEEWLAEITGFAAVSLQPNAGAQGEYAGLLAIRAFHESRGEGHRDVCLIPASAHGTNPASAAMAGMKIVAVACDSQGNIDLADLKAQAREHRRDLACLMVTYPSTCGVFESAIREICNVIHAHGGQVYMDGANMNAQVGLTSPGFIGADVCHLNLHKTFCIPHGGGGPGVGPVGVARRLVEFLPGHPLASVSPAGGHPKSGTGPVAAAPWGSAGILPISWMYVAMMGADGLAEATKFSILNANYISRRLEAYFPTLYRGNGLVAHECILDLRAFKSVTAEDVAKRLMDYGFHAPTLSWPVPGTLMVEPTESESKAELDRFCDAMISIHAEMSAIETDAADPKNNVLKNAPHTADMLAASEWNHPYTRELAAFPAKSLLDFKFWPYVGRVDNVYGDRNPVCACE
ncbi:MAG: aminomethyl-transferring glycine dehydrogenase [Verrucomicrobia bacterium]|nr:aminomethyl-transferring glycine dehydrogenase [Verrucomicrobiota bacterium]MDE3099375.1 aminomethyl-transferring glycine dehydrogenase [Verrucomicrobiota bacterium]